MKITNKYGYPELYVRAVKNDSYSKGDADISVTQLIDSPRIRVLRERHYHELEEDVSDRIYSLQGQLTHLLLERANMDDKRYVVERRLFIEVEGLKVSGSMDLYDTQTAHLYDHKNVSVWSLIYGDSGKWEKQMNLYAAMLRRHGHKIEKLTAIAIMRDWSINKAEQDPNYPQLQVMQIPVPLWSEGQAERYLKERVILHKQAQVTLPECTKEERFINDECWAIMRPGRKSALKLFYNEVEAKDYLKATENLKTYIEYRPGTPTRCMRYCNLSKFCSQYQDEIKPKIIPLFKEVT